MLNVSLVYILVFFGDVLDCNVLDLGLLFVKFILYLISKILTNWII